MGEEHTALGHWRDPATPKAGWVCVDVEDLGEPSDTCQMCGSAVIRYVHVMEHEDYPDVLRVGCICAGYMECDLDAAHRRERAMRSRAVRLQRWMRRTWLTSAKGNPYLKADGRLLVLYQRRDGWHFAIDGRPSRYAHASEQAARRAAFDGIEWLRQRATEDAYDAQA